MIVTSYPYRVTYLQRLRMMACMLKDADWSWAVYLATMATGYTRLSCYHMDTHIVPNTLISSGANIEPELELDCLNFALQLFSFADKRYFIFTWICTKKRIDVMKKNRMQAYHSDFFICRYKIGQHTKFAAIEKFTCPISDKNSRYYNYLGI